MFKSSEKSIKRFKKDSPQNCSKPRPCFKVLSKRRRQCVKLFKTKTVVSASNCSKPRQCLRLFKSKTVHQTVQKQDSPLNCSQPRQPIKLFTTKTVHQTVHNQDSQAKLSQNCVIASPSNSSERRQHVKQLWDPYQSPRTSPVRISGCVPKVQALGTLMQ